MRTRPPPRTRAYTLVEMLVALAVLATIFSIIVAFLPANTAMIINNVKASEAQIATTQISSAIAADFRKQGTFAGFIKATDTSVNAIFKASQGFDPTPSADFANDMIMSVPRLKAAVGDHLLIVSSDGNAKILTVTAVNGSAFSHDGCTNGMASANTQVYKADLLNIVFDGTDVLRGLNGGPLVKAGNGGQLQFEYLYRSKTGALLLNPPGAPNNLSTDGSQLAYLKIGVAKDRGGDANAVPLEPSPLRQLVDCGTTLPGAVVDNRLKVTVTGLPAGTNADVTTNGPGMPNTPTPVTTIYPVGQGQYNVTANPVTVGGVTYTPVVDGAPINMTGFTQRSYVAVTYKQPGLVYGGMQLTVTGLNGSSATLSIQGPSAYTTSITDGIINEDNLVPGTYTLVPSPSGTASPRQPSYTLVVPPGVRTPITIDFTTQQPGTGNMDITVTGLNGASANATITGPSGVNVVLTDGVQRVPNLPAGTYTITPASTGALSPQSATYTVTINVGLTTPVTINYVPGTGGGCPPGCPPPPGGCTPAPCPTQTGDTGTLHINVSGLNGAQASSYLTGPYTANIPLTDGTVNVSPLPVGSYVLNPFATATLDPSVSTISFTISKDTTTTVTVTYIPGQAAPKGILTLKVIGLPLASNANVGLFGPTPLNMNPQDTNAIVTTPTAIPGLYTINAPSAVNASGATVNPTNNGRSFVLVSGQQQDIVVDYTGTPGPTIICTTSCTPPPICTPAMQHQGDCDGPGNGGSGGSGGGCPPGMYIQACGLLGLTPVTGADYPSAPPGTPADVFVPGGIPGATNPQNPTVVGSGGLGSFCVTNPYDPACTGSGSGATTPVTTPPVGTPVGTTPPVTTAPTPTPTPTPAPTPTPTTPPGGGTPPVVVPGPIQPTPT